MRADPLVEALHTRPEHNSRRPLSHPEAFAG